jgi:hypothetical protein
MYAQHPTPVWLAFHVETQRSLLHLQYMQLILTRQRHSNAPIPAPSSCTCTAPRQRTKHNVFAVDSARRQIVNPSQTFELTVHAGGDNTVCALCSSAERPATIIRTSAGTVSFAIRVRIHLFSHHGHPRTDKSAPSHHSVRTWKPHMH